MSKKKKVIILSCMVALLAVAAVFNYVFTTERVPQSSAQTVYAGASSYFAQYRTERLNTRNEEMLQLDSVLNAAEADSEEYAEALNMKVNLVSNTEKEMLLESLIKAYGFEDAVVVIGLESSNVNVMAKSDNLTTDDAVAIYTIVAEETAVSPENVKIIPIS
ncbi:MAG: SpoIIIAH-like family protein [Clostridia bacterium]|nr:SpoIIIAH-like family protein [Clostridia bacterium]